MISLYVLGALLVVLLLGVVLAPLLEREPPDRDLEDLPPGERYDAAREALRELEFEYRTDKLREEDYRRLRARYGRLALEAEEAMEAEAGAAAADAAPVGGSGAGAAGPAGSGRDEEPEPPSRDDGDAGRACGSCGEALPAGARFCPACGAERERS